MSGCDWMFVGKKKSGDVAARSAAFQQSCEKDANVAKPRKPFSKVWAGADHLDKLSADDPNYGRPPPGSKTEARGMAAHGLISREVMELCEMIHTYGEVGESGYIDIPFGELFSIYTKISNKLVGVLLRARRQGLVHFVGEMLFQRRDDDVIISLLKTPAQITWEREHPEEVAAAEDMDEIMPGLYVGGLSAAKNSDLLRKNNITHILTVESVALLDEHTKGFKYMYIHADDDSEQDLLSYFSLSNEFITDAIEEGSGLKGTGVLVHCFVGCSRSATLAAAYIMQKFRHTTDETMKLMRGRRFVSPNQGFMSQLRAYEHMGYRVDERDMAFKCYRLKSFAKKMRYRSMEKQFPETFCAQDPVECDPGGETPVYRCAKCRRNLFTGQSVITHGRGIGEAAFDWRAQLFKQMRSRMQARGQMAGQDTSVSDSSGPTCTESIFIEPVQWMRETILDVQGKLACPNCSLKLGSFHWAGELCACGTYVAPSFHIHMNKVDRGSSHILPPTSSTGLTPPATNTASTTSTKPTTSTRSAGSTPPT